MGKVELPKKKKKKIETSDLLSLGVFGLIIVLLGIGIFIVSNMTNNEKKFNYNESNPNNRLYAVLKSKEKNYMVFEDVDTNEPILVHNNFDLKKGDVVLLEYTDNIDKSTFKVIGTQIDYSETTTVKPAITTTVNNTTTKKQPTTAKKKVSTTTSKPVKTTVTVNTSSNEIILGISDQVNSLDVVSNDGTLKSKLKTNFITLVDFIFYDGTIKGKTFNQLSKSAQAKVIYYALQVDGKIDKQFPGYKETISSKMTDIKDKLIAKYMEVTMDVCSKAPGMCDDLKEDFQTLKRNFGFSWDVIKGALKYAADKGITALKTWYEIYSGKA